MVGLHTTLDWISNQQFDNVDFVLDCKKVVFRSFLGLRLQITCLGTLGTEFLPLVSLLRPLESLILSLESSQFFSCS